MHPWLSASLALLILFALPFLVQAQEDRGALVTALEGKATLVKGIEKRPLAVFERLETNDLIALEQGKITLVFFLTSRQETWQGTGKIEIGPGEGKGSGLAAPEAKTLAPFLVKQIAKTPMLVAQGRAGVTRLRAHEVIEAALRDPEMLRSNNSEAKLLASLSRKACREFLDLSGSVVFELSAFSAGGGRWRRA